LNIPTWTVETVENGRRGYLKELAQNIGQDHQDTVPHNETTLPDPRAGHPDIFPEEAIEVVDACQKCV
jgi:hypothetical protein